MPSIKIFSTKSCRYCILAKTYFNENGLEYTEVDLTNQPDEIDKIKTATGHRTVPIILVNDKVVGGYSDMIAQIESGTLKLK